jgi:hypothetical protein
MELCQVQALRTLQVIRTEVLPPVLVFSCIWCCRPGGDLSKCRLLVQPLATGGQLINDDTLSDKLVGSPHFEDCVGGEMEAWGIYQGARACGFNEWIVVKGVSDFASEKRYDYQPLAAAAAVDAVFSVLAESDAILKIEVGACRADHHGNQ